MTRNPLRQRDFASILAAGLISETGDWLLIIALPLYVFTTTGSALSTSTLFLAELFPALVLGSFAGVLADRWEPARTMIWVNVAQLLMLIPLLAADRHRLWLVFVVAGGEALLETLFTPAKQTLLRRLLAADQLQAGNALIGVNANLARLIGSPLGGLAIAVLGLRTIVVLDAASYLVSAALIVAARPTQVAASLVPAANPGFLREWAAGLAVIRGSRRLTWLVVLTVIGQLAQGMFVVLFVLFIRRTLDDGDAQLGLIRGMQATGAVAGGVFVSRLGAVSGRTMVGGGFAVFGLVSLATWNAPSVSTTTWLYIVLFALAGIPAVALDTGLITEVQLDSPLATLGRVLAAGQACGRSAEAVGLILAGTLADHLALVTLLDLQGALYLLCGFVALIVPRQPQADGDGLQQLSNAAARSRPGTPSGVS